MDRQRAIQLAYKRRMARVRTPAGAQRFGQSIGQVIRRDLIERARALLMRGDEHGAGPRRHQEEPEPRPVRSRLTPGDFIGPWEIDPHHTGYTNTKDRDYIRQTHEGVWLTVKPTAHGTWIWQIEGPPDLDAEGNSATRVRRTGRTKGFERAKQLAEWAAGELIHERGQSKSIFPIDDMNKRSTITNGVPYTRSHGGDVHRDLGNVRLGIYRVPYHGTYRAYVGLPSGEEFGIFKTWGGSLVEQEKIVDDLYRAFNRNPDLPKLLKRQRKAQKTWQDFSKGVRGVHWRESDDPKPNTTKVRRELARKESEALGVEVDDRMPVEMQEIANTVLRAYETAFPGVLSLLKGDDAGITYHINVEPYPDFPETRAVAYYHRGLKRHYASINFNSTYWSQDRARLDAAGTSLANESDHFHVARPAGEPRDFKEPWEYNFITTMHHEMGHVFHELLFDNPGAVQELLLELNRMGIGLGGTEGSRYQDLGLFALNRAAADLLVSGYGTTNLMELLAEAWAEYVQDPHPREGIVQIASIIQKHLNSYLKSLKREGR